MNEAAEDPFEARSRRVLARLERARAAREARRAFIADRVKERWDVTDEEARSFAFLVLRPGNILFAGSTYRPENLRLVLRAWVRHHRTDYERALLEQSFERNADGVLRAEDTIRSNILSEMNVLADAWLDEREKHGQ